MTTETRSMIEFADIAAVEIECTSCSTRITKPINENLFIPCVCSSCKSIFFVENSTAWHHLQVTLSTIGNMGKERTPFRLRLETKAPEVNRR